VLIKWFNIQCTLTTPYCMLSSVDWKSLWGGGNCSQSRHRRSWHMHWSADSVWGGGGSAIALHKFGNYAMQTVEYVCCKHAHMFGCWPCAWMDAASAVNARPTPGSSCAGEHQNCVNPRAHAVKPYYLLLPWNPAASHWYLHKFLAVKNLYSI